MGAAGDAELGRLRWRCRRGMRELDVLLAGWLETHWATATPVRRRAFGELLDQQDPELWAWCTGRSPAPRADWQALVDEFRAGASR